MGSDQIVQRRCAYFAIAIAWQRVDKNHGARQKQRIDMLAQRCDDIRLLQRRRNDHGGEPHDRH